MAEPSGQGALSRHAAWVALRTLRQRPKPVGRSYRGQPVFELHSVELVLQGEAAHFDRLVHCSKCGRETPGGPVLTAADLDHPAHPVICRDCVRGAAIAPSRPPERRSPAPTTPAHPPPAEAPAANEPVVAPAAAAEEQDDGRLAALEAGAQKAITLLTELADVQRSESIERRQAQAAFRSEMQAALVQGVGAVRAELTASVETAASATARIEDELHQSLIRVAELLDAQRGELGAVAGAVADNRNELHAVVESNRELNRAQSDLDQRVDDLASGLAQAREREGSSEGPDRPMQEDYARLAAVVEGQGAQLQAALAESLARELSRASELEQRVEERLAALTSLLQAQRTELFAALDNGVRLELGAVGQAVDELALSRREVDGRLEELAGAWGAGESALRVLEKRIQESLDQLAEKVEAQGRGLQSALALLESRRGDAPPRASSTGSASGLLEELERQLRDADARLASRAEE
jgi:hypothetical protein